MPNFRRGFNRLFVVGACLWLALVAGAGWKDHETMGVATLIGMAVVPPLLVYIVGASIGWALRGFKK